MSAETKICSLVEIGGNREEKRKRIHSTKSFDSWGRRIMSVGLAQSPEWKVRDARRGEVAEMKTRFLATDVDT